MLFTVIAAFIVAVLSGMGVGGGGLFVVFLSLFSDLPQIRIQGINLLFFIFSAGSAVLIHISKRHIFGRAVLTMALFGILGAIVGSVLTTYLPSALLRKAFGVMLVITGTLSLKKQVRERIKKNAENR